LEAFLSGDDYGAELAEKYGCSLAAVGSELTRANKEMRYAASCGFDDLVSIMTGSIEGLATSVARKRATIAMAAMIGAVTVSRIICTSSDFI
jgi:TetR/AcrR family transcriptional regulator, transcriptional repressor for nem operon